MTSSGKVPDPVAFRQMNVSVEFLLRHTSDAILLVDADGRVRGANAAAEALLQQPVSAFEGSSLADVIPEFADSRAEKQLREHSAVSRRLDHFSPSRYTWYEIRVVPLREERVLFLRDITDRVRQTKTEAVKEALRQIIMDAPVAISITNGPEHRYEIVNNMARKLIGDRQVEGRRAREAFPDVDPELFKLLDSVYSTGQPFSAKDLTVAFDRDGSGTPVEGTFDVTYQPIFEADGTVSGVMSISVETTDYVAERRRLEGRAPAPAKS